MSTILAVFLVTFIAAHVLAQSSMMANFTVCSTISSSGSSAVSPVPTFSFGSAVNIVTTNFVQPTETLSEILPTAKYTLTNTAVSTIYETTIHPETIYEYTAYTSTVGTLTAFSTTYLTGSPSMYTIYASGLGQEIEDVWPASVECTHVAYAVATAWSTLPTTTITTTSTPLNTVSSITLTSNVSLGTITGTPVPTAFTVTSTETYYAAATNISTITEKYAPSTVGTMYNAACHPESLISAYMPTSGPNKTQSFPLGPPIAVASAARAYMPYPTRDPSACCQLCMQNQGCAGVVDTPEPGQGQGGLCEFYMIYADAAAMGLEAPDGRCGQVLSFGQGPGYSGQVGSGQLIYADGCAKAGEH